MAPFITEARAQTAPEGRPRQGLLIVEAWPDLPDTYADAAAEAEIGLVIATVAEGCSVARVRTSCQARGPDLIVVEASPAQGPGASANAQVIVHTLRSGCSAVRRRQVGGAIVFAVAARPWR